MPAPDPLEPPVALRVLDGVQAPYPGTLRATDPPTLWVEDTECDIEALAWDADADEHLLAPLDLARTAAGVALVLPACPTRLSEFVDRRVAVGDDEAVTIAVSLLRGCAAVQRRGRSEGGWWLTADGRPVLAVGGSSDAAVGASRLLTELAVEREPTLAAALTHAASLVVEPRALRREQGEAEQALFRAAAPGPLLLDAAPVRAQALSVTARVSAVEVGAHLDPGIADRIRVAAEGVWSSIVRRREGRRATRPERASSTAAPPAASARRGAAPVGPAPSRRRRAPLMVGGAVAAVIAIVGVAWPAPAEDAATETPIPAATTSLPPEANPAGGLDATPAPPSDPAPTPSASVGPGAVEVGAEALLAYAECADDACRAALQEDPSRALPAGPATVAAAGRVIELVDDYGGVAVLRARGADGLAQFAVIVTDPADGGGTRKWLIRDVYDAADQP